MNEFETEEHLISIDWNNFKGVCLDKMYSKIFKNPNGYRECKISDLLKGLSREIEEFERTKYYNPIEYDEKELIDIANFCMMLYYRKIKEK